VGIHLGRDVLAVDVSAGGIVQSYPAQRIDQVRLRKDSFVVVRAVCLASYLLKKDVPVS